MASLLLVAMPCAPIVLILVVVKKKGSSSKCPNSFVRSDLPPGRSELPEQHIGKEPEQRSKGSGIESCWATKVQLAPELAGEIIVCGYKCFLSFIKVM